jgi:hypothetical protein
MTVIIGPSTWTRSPICAPVNAGSSDASRVAASVAVTLESVGVVRRVSAAQRSLRRIRILGWLQSGLSYAEIAGLEGITRRRVGQIPASA